MNKKAHAIFCTLILCLISFSCYSIPYDPIALYLTWQKSPESTMTIRWITDPSQQDDSIYYQENGNNTWITNRGSHSQFPQNKPYLLHTLELINLTPNTSYLFRIGTEGIVYKFKTLPQSLTNTEIRFVVGGDMYHDTLEDLSTTNRQAAKTHPQFVLIGGDIAYASGKGFFNRIFGQKFDRWLDWLKAWKKDMITPEGYLIPMLPVLGNHDVIGGFGQTPTEAPYFYYLFPMPGPQGYNVLDFGNYMSLFLLDSGHTHPIDGEQTTWLENALRSRVHIPHKFALYHVPAYPSFRPFANKFCTSVRTNWVPLFDQYSLTASFENHDHDYKRSHRLRHNQIDDTGVLYLGDGAWGVDKPRNNKDKRWYVNKSLSSRHFIQVVVQSDKRHITAIAPDGTILDTYSW